MSLRFDLFAVAARRGHRLIRLIALIVALLAFPLPAAARTIAVPGQAPTIKGAMIQARRGDIILVACGVYHEADILVKPGVTLWSGTLRPECVTIDASGQGRCLIFSEADSSTQVAGFTLRGGSARGEETDGFGGAVFSEDSSPRLTHCTLSGNDAVSGGAVYAKGSAGPQFEYCLFTGNEADRDGGAVLWSAAAGSFRGCTMRGNDAMGSGGALAGRGGALRIDDCLIQDNSAGHSGGGLNLAATTALVSGTVLVGNAGGLGGGALAAHDTSPLLRHCTLHANLADGDATAVRLVRAAATFESCLISGSGNPVLEADESSVAISGSNVHVAGTGTWPGVLAAAQGQPGNLASDPLYCAPAAGDLHLGPASPCLRPDGERPIGALGSGCGAKFPADVLD